MNDDPSSLASLLFSSFSGKESEKYLLYIEKATKKLVKGDNRFQLNIPKLKVRAGEFVAIVGESGCGKSTLLDLLALISAPTTALQYQLSFTTRHYFDVAQLWREEDDAALAYIRQEYLGYILQTGGLLPYLSVEKNLALPINIKKNKIIRSELLDMAERMGVSSCLSRLPNSLSGGQRQRVAILRALLHQPKLVLADEPTAAVDKQRAFAIVEDLNLLAKEKNMAILMVTHDIDLVKNISNKTYSFQLEEVGYQDTHSTLFQL